MNKLIVLESTIIAHVKKTKFSQLLTQDRSQVIKMVLKSKKLISKPFECKKYKSLCIVEEFIFDLTWVEATNNANVNGCLEILRRTNAHLARPVTERKHAA